MTAIRPRCSVRFLCCVIDGVFASGADGQVHFAEAGALTPEDLAAVQQQFARALRRRIGASNRPSRFSSRSEWQVSDLEFQPLNVA